MKDVLKDLVSIASNNPKTSIGIGGGVLGTAALATSIACCCKKGCGKSGMKRVDEEEIKSKNGGVENKQDKRDMSQEPDDNVSDNKQNQLMREKNEKSKDEDGDANDHLSVSGNNSAHQNSGNQQSMEQSSTHERHNQMRDQEQRDQRKTETQFDNKTLDGQNIQQDVIANPQNNDAQPLNKDYEPQSNQSDIQQSTEHAQQQNTNDTQQTHFDHTSPDSIIQKNVNVDSSNIESIVQKECQGCNKQQQGAISKNVQSVSNMLLNNSRIADIEQKINNVNDIKCDDNKKKDALKELLENQKKKMVELQTLLNSNDGQIALCKLVHELRSKCNQQNKEKQVLNLLGIGQLPNICIQSPGNSTSAKQITKKASRSTPPKAQPDYSIFINNWSNEIEKQNQKFQSIIKILNNQDREAATEELISLSPAISAARSNGVR